MPKRSFLPPSLQRGLAALLVLLLAISVARLLTRAHQLEERIEQLEELSAAQSSRIERLADLLNLSRAGSEADQASHPVSSAEGKARFQSHRRGAVSSSGPSQSYDSDSASHPDAAPQPDATPASFSPAARSSKYTEPRRFNLNHIDSLTLIRIPGIAARTASTILRYRERYGGFYDPWQLQDFLTWDAAQAYMEEWCTQWFTADVTDVRHIRINQATVSELQRHPYITYQQALEIVRYRTRHKRIEKVEEFENFSTFQPADVQRLSMYLSFE